MSFDSKGGLPPYKPKGEDGLPLPATSTAITSTSASAAPIGHRGSRSRRFALLALVIFLTLFHVGPDLPRLAANTFLQFWDSSNEMSGGCSRRQSIGCESGPPLVGFEGYQGTHRREQRFLQVPEAESARMVSKAFTARQHIAGTASDRATAFRIKAQLQRNLGLEVTDPDSDVFEAGSAESRRALFGPSAGKKHRKCRHGRRHKTHKRLLRWFKSYGIDAQPSADRHSCICHGKRDRSPRVWVDTYYPWLNYPVSSSLTLTPPGASEPSFVASLKEDVLPEDPTSGSGPATFHGLSKNGTARGQLVYVGRGTHAEFQAMQNRGIDFKGKIVIAQYSGSFRGLKAQAAAEYGAVGVLIYSDPVSDYNVTIEQGVMAYPYGPARNPSSVQRGSVQFLSIYPGDPLTPGTPAYKEAKRLPEDDPTINIPSIPSLPISYEDAIPLLKSLNGHGWPNPDREGWREGGLRYRGVEYWSGPGEDEVELVNIMDGGVTPIWNTYALIPGKLEDEIVVIGNHHDAWTFGAGDPNSGTASVHEVVRGFGELLKEGWSPLRTILIAAWDAEEYGLIGSTEFGEDYAEYLKERVVAYLNVDVSVAGTDYGIRASPSLGDLLKNVSSVVRDPDHTERSLLDRMMAQEVHVRDLNFDAGVISVQSDEEDKLVKGGGGAIVAPLGSGSDFTVFLQHLGIASSDSSFSPQPGDPIYHYHSNYDSAHWMDTYGDPSFERHIAIAKVLGLAALRLIESDILPLNVTAYAHELAAYVDKVPVHLVVDEQQHGSLQDALNGVKHAVKEVQRAAEKLDEESVEAGRAFDQERKVFLVTSDLLASAMIGSTGSGMSEVHSRTRQRQQERLRQAWRRVRSVNRRRRTFEQGFIDEKGLEGRQWYKNLVVAPGRRLGYGATTLPGLTEAITLDHDVEQAKREAKRLVKMFKKVARELRRA